MHCAPCIECQKPAGPFVRRLFLAIATLTVFTGAHAIEEPRFTVEKTYTDFEVRQYAPYLVAEVSVAGNAEDAGNAAFRILAAYIFGKNQGERKLAMTAPVTQFPESRQMAMTAPVVQTQGTGSYRVQFVLPADVTLETAPVPVDARVRLRQESGARVAVIRYSGFWSDANYQEHLARLQAGLTSAGLSWDGEPVLARYNPPFTPWFLRRNEIWLHLADSPHSGP